MLFHFCSPAISYGSAIYPAGRTAEGCLNEGPSHPTFSSRRDRTVLLVLKVEVIELGGVEEISSPNLWGPGLPFSYKNMRDTLPSSISQVLGNSSTAQGVTT